MKMALYVRHQAKPGQREEVRRVWEKYVRPRAHANVKHDDYFYCFDRTDPDVISAFQVYSDEDGLRAFTTGSWYSEYVAESAPFLMGPPLIQEVQVEWSKR